MVMSKANITYRPKSFSISASALGGRGNGATSRVMISEVRGEVASAFVSGNEFRLRRDVGVLVT